MTTLNSAIQTLVNNLETKMLSNVPLSAEEQTLIAGAIDKLAQHASLEQAVVAVAEEHLESAEDSLTEVVNAAKTDLIQQVSEVKTDLMKQVTEAKNTMVSQLTDAKNALNSTLTNASSSMNAAQQDIDEASQTLATQNQHLTLIPEVKAGLQAVGDVMQQQVAESVQKTDAQLKKQLARMPKNVYAVKPIEVNSTSGNNRRSAAVFAVYDENGDTHAVRPSYDVATSAYENTRLEYIKIDPNAVKSTVRTHYVHSSTFQSTPSTYIYRYGCSAILPLATKNQPNNLSYEVVYSTQTTNNNASSSYKGVYIRSAGTSTTTKPKQNINATDQWGLTTRTSHGWNDVGVLYDNKKHCLVMVDINTSRIVEKYRDGDITTSTTITSSSALQSFVNKGDYTVVYFISHCLPWAYGIRIFNATEVSVYESHYYDLYGFYGRNNNEVKMGGEKYSAHYQFTKQKVLQPIVYHFTSSIDAYAHGGAGVSSTAISHVSLVSFSGDILGQYKLNFASDDWGRFSGCAANAITCINPYSNVGFINEDKKYVSSNYYYGIGRTCKAY